jgi:hypothetical protein
MPTYDGIGSSVTHEIEVVGDVFISNVEGGSLSTQVPFEIFSNVYGMVSPPTDSRQVRLRVQPTSEASPDNSYVTDMGIQNTTDNYFFITAPQNTSNVGDQNTFVISKTSNVGIGTTNPTSTLHVVGNELITGTLSASNIVGGSPLTITSDENLQVNSNLTVGTSNLFVNNVNGRVGIGTDSPDLRLTLKTNWSTQQYDGLFMRDTNDNGFVELAAGSTDAGGAKSLGYMRLYGTDGVATNAIFLQGSGSSYINGGNVGIGVVSPGAPLEVVSTRNADTWSSGASQLNVLNYNGSGSWYGMSFAVSQSRRNGVIQTFNKNSGVAQYHLELQPSAGNVGIGMAGNPSSKVQIEGGTTELLKLVHTGVATIRTGIDTGGNYFIYNPTSTGVYMPFNQNYWASNSDRRIKRDVVEMTNCLENISNIRPVYYNYQFDEDNQPRRIGFIAQEWQEQYPEVVSSTTRDDCDFDVLGLAYSETMPVLLGAIKEQQALIENLKARIESFENSS